MIADQVYDKAYRADDLGDVKPKVQIGGKGEKFVPNMNLSFELGSGSEQLFINVNRKSVSVTTETESNAAGKLSLSVGDETDIWHVDELGRLKWDIAFASAPKKNTFEWDIKCSDTIEFWRQDELTEDQVKRGYSRPDEVIGSYAVYSGQSGHFVDEDGNTIINFATGKLCHIYRPLCSDANGVTAWADLLIEKNKLSITIPQDYLDAAAYPVTLDPTFGYATHGASTFTIDDTYCLANTLAAQEYTATSGDTITGFTIYASGSGNVGVSAYSCSGNAPSSRLAAEASITVSTSAAEYSVGSLSQSLTGGTKYCVAMNNKSKNATGIRYDTPGGNASAYQVATSLPASWGTASYDTSVYSLWATYTAGGASASWLKGGYWWNQPFNNQL